MVAGERSIEFCELSLWSGEKRESYKEEKEGKCQRMVHSIKSLRDRTDKTSMKADDGRKTNERTGDEATTLHRRKISEGEKRKGREKRRKEESA